MASVITERFGSGHANMAPGGNQGQPTLAAAMRDGIDDMTEIRTQFTALLAKLDADVGVTDTDYASTLTPTAQLLTKG